MACEHPKPQQFTAIRCNPDTEQLREWWRDQRGTEEFLAQLEDELLVRSGLKETP